MASRVSSKTPISDPQSRSKDTNQTPRRRLCQESLKSSQLPFQTTCLFGPWRECAKAETIRGPGWHHVVLTSMFGAVSTEYALILGLFWHAGNEIWYGVLTCMCEDRLSLLSPSVSKSNPKTPRYSSQSYILDPDQDSRK
jgi:hypothetical protein